jgi:hypothetical protein
MRLGTAGRREREGAAGTSAGSRVLPFQDPVDFDANALLASLVIGAVGFVAFAYGKRQGRLPQMLAGLVLLIFPYFVSNVLLMLGIAAAVLAALWVAVRAGW